MLPWEWFQISDTCHHAKLSLSYWSMVMMSPVEFSTGEFGAKHVSKVL